MSNMNRSLKILFLSLFLIGCNADVINERIGLFVKTKGLNPEQVNAYANQALKADKGIGFGEELTIEILGIDDFRTDENGRVFPGGENTLVDSDDNVIYYVEDYFKKYELTGVSTKDAKSLKFNLRVGKPMTKDSSYRFLFRLWDKKGKKELKGNIELLVK
jgi:hypothetical protein